MSEKYPELSTLLDVIRYGATHFSANKLYFGHGTESAWDEAAWLAFHTLHLAQDTHAHILQCHLLASEKNAILKLYQRRVEERIPAAYLIHEAFFAGFNFFVDERVLIPRSPMAEIIENHFEPWFPYPEKILDLCTGSGCIAIAAALYCEDAKVTAVDLSPQALEVAKINCERYHLNQRLKLLESDLFDALNNQTFDVIISNPPYVSSDEMRSLPEEYRHEPNLALEAKDQGLALVDKILHQAAKHLTEEGILLVEVGNSAEALEQRYPNVPWLWLSFERGGDGVFLLTKEQLQEAFP